MKVERGKDGIVVTIESFGMNHCETITPDIARQLAEEMVRAADEAEGWTYLEGHMTGRLYRKRGDTEQVWVDDRWADCIEVPTSLESWLECCDILPASALTPEQRGEK